jgi:4-hydroxythreonine-4-phosphate dehydrogenase
LKALPRLIITSGEPAGIGPDLCLAIAARAWPCDLRVAADATVLLDRNALLHAGISIESCAPDAPGQMHQPGTLRLLHIPTQSPVRPGHLDQANARYVLALLDAAVRGCLDGSYDAMVTAPVQKSIINEAGITFYGHTEYLAERIGNCFPVMLLTAGTLRVALATTHLPLTQVSAAIDAPRLEQVLHVLHHDLTTRFGIAQPRILVCGLNPHAGESGHLGREEIDVIAPVVERLRQQGKHVIGPVPADTAFTPHQLQQVDAVLAMFHDQGLPVLKYAGFGQAVNVTLGLPIVRTSVDHGTALALAGTGQADAGSLVAAVELALQMAARHEHAPVQRSLG